MKQTKKLLLILVVPLLLSLLVACRGNRGPEVLPTVVSAANLPVTPTEIPTIDPNLIPPTWTPPPATGIPSPFPTVPGYTPQPTNTPLTRPTPRPTSLTLRPSPSPFPPLGPPETLTPTPGPAPVIKHINLYAPDEIVPVEAFPRPRGDNGWGMHWIPTVSQDRAVVDRFVSELSRMHIKWVVFLNEGTQIGDNDYLVDQLVSHGIMPIMRLFRSGILPYDGEIGPMVRHYRARGVYYYQIYNEPNVNEENHQGFANPSQYALAWAVAAREVVANGGLPGIAALSPGGAYDHFEFLDRTLTAVKWNGDEWLLNKAWLSIHNYHGTRAYDDPGGFLLFRSYNEIVTNRLGRPLPMLGTEGGSYSNDMDLEINLITFQYNYMRQREPYLLTFSYWILASQEGGAADPNWEWQALFRAGFVHPVVPGFFYQNSQ